MLTDAVAVRPILASPATSPTVSTKPVSAESSAEANTMPSTEPSVAISGPPELPARTTDRMV